MNLRAIARNLVTNSIPVGRKPNPGIALALQIKRARPGCLIFYKKCLRKQAETNVSATPSELRSVELRTSREKAKLFLGVEIF